MTRRTAAERGLDPAGHIRREGRPELIGAPFRPLVADLLHEVTELFGPPGREAYAVGLDQPCVPREAEGPGLHSIHLYGSVPRGTAVVGRSDLDVGVLLNDEPTVAQRVACSELAADLARRHPVVSEVGILLDPVALFLDPAQRHDAAFHLRCLCTPLAGPDLAAGFAPYAPTRDLARGLQGDLDAVLVALAQRLSEDPGRSACRAVGRRLLRVAFSLVIWSWPGWTSDPVLMREAFTEHHRGWEEETSTALELGWRDRSDVSAARRLLEGGFGNWLAETYHSL